MVKRIIDSIILISFLFFHVKSQNVPSLSQSTNTAFQEKYLLHVNTFFTTYSITEPNLGDSAVGRSTLYFVNLLAGRKIYKPFFIGVKTQYHLFHSTFFNSAKLDYQSGYYAGVWLGIEFLNIKERFYAGMRYHVGINSMRMLNVNGFSNFIVTKYWFRDYGLELNGGLRIGRSSHITFGLSLNNFLKMNAELNYFQFGLLLTAPKPLEARPKWFKPKNKPSY
jgi:hypothetical protein